MKLAVVGILLGSLHVAHAGAAFDEYSADVEQRAATQLYEASCDMTVEVRGAVATVDIKQRIVNPQAPALAANVELAMPPGSRITSFSANGQAAVPVAATSPSLLYETLDGADAFGVDPAFLRTRDDGYQIILQPIAPGDDIKLATRYVTVASVRSGGLRVVLPGRDAQKLTACKGHVRALPGPGATVRAIRISGTETRGARAPLTVDVDDVTIDIELAIAGNRPILWSQTQALADGWHASLVTALGPRVKASGARRVVFVIDGSRSMDLVGRHNVVKVIERIGAALPSGSEVEAVMFDRVATRVFDELRPATPDTITELARTVSGRPAGNGTDIVRALREVRPLISNVRGQAMVIVISDGVVGEVDRVVIAHALGAKSTTVDVHAIVLAPATTRSPGTELLRAPVNLYGGAVVELAVDRIDDALGQIDEWLRPAWVDITVHGAEWPAPRDIRAGGGFVHLEVHRGPVRYSLGAKDPGAFRVAARPAPTAPIATLALGVLGDAFAGATNGDVPDADLLHLEAVYAKARPKHALADRDRAFAVLATDGRVAKSRRDVVKASGRYERIILARDPVAHVAVAKPASAAVASAISRDTLERLFRDQLQPKAYTCYQRALPRNPKLEGTAYFTFHMGRGEVTHVSLVGLGDAQLDHCLIDAGYTLAPPLPDFNVNADDQTIAKYPLTFKKRADQVMIVLGDADSSSPLDIEGIEGGVPRTPTSVDTKTPLGRMRPK